MTGYTRQSTFIPGDVIKAEHGNDEFNQVVAFAAQASGHKHDGTVAEGAYIPVISDTTNTDKVEIVTGGAKTTGTHQVTGLVTADAAITAGTTITAGTGITATTGNVTVSSGNVAVTGNITVSGTVDGRDVLADGTKLDTIETAATADQTNAEIKTAYELNANTNEFSDAEQTKLAGIETLATADQSNAEVKTAYELNANTNEFSDAEQTKLAGIATSANLYVHPAYAGDDFSVDTTLLSGATVVSDIDINVTTDATGHVTDTNGTVATRVLTLANLGYTGETNATADQTAAEIKAAYITQPNTFNDADHTKLNGIATSANLYVLPSSVVHDTESGALHATDALRISGHTISLFKGNGTSETVVVPDNDTIYTQPTTAGAVGTYAFLKQISSLATYAAGATKAGSQLNYSSDGGVTGGAPAGTWRCMGHTTSGFPTTLWLRIS